VLSLQVSHHISLLGPPALIRRCDDLPATTTHVPVATVLVLNTPDDGCLRPKHVEWLCRNKTCTVLHQVGVSFDLRITYLCICWIMKCFNRHWCTVQTWRWNELLYTLFKYSWDLKGLIYFNVSCVTLKTPAAHSRKQTVSVYQTAQRNITEGSNNQNYRHNTIKSYQIEPIYCEVACNTITTLHTIIFASVN
jgi:hypothetical protein